MQSIGCRRPDRIARKIMLLRRLPDQAGGQRISQRHILH